MGVYDVSVSSFHLIKSFCAIPKSIAPSLKYSLNFLIHILYANVFHGFFIPKNITELFVGLR